MEVILLGGDHVFADAWHRAWRLDGRYGGLGYAGRGARFRRGACGILALYFWTTFPSAVVLGGIYLTRPLGATVGDLLDKPRSAGLDSHSADRWRQLLPCSIYF